MSPSPWHPVEGKNFCLGSTQSVNMGIFPLLAVCVAVLDIVNKWLLGGPGYYSGPSKRKPLQFGAWAPGCYQLLGRSKQRDDGRTCNFNKGDSPTKCQWSLQGSGRPCLVAFGFLRFCWFIRAPTVKQWRINTSNCSCWSLMSHMIQSVLHKSEKKWMSCSIKRYGWAVWFRLQSTKVFKGGRLWGDRNTNFFMTKHLNEVLPMRFHGPFKGMKMCGTQLYDE